MAMAVRAAIADDPKAIDNALPEPKPLIRSDHDDKWDRSAWWETTD